MKSVFVGFVLINMVGMVIDYLIQWLCMVFDCNLVGYCFGRIEQGCFYFEKCCCVFFEFVDSGVLLKNVVVYFGLLYGGEYISSGVGNGIINQINNYGI